MTRRLTIVITLALAVGIAAAEPAPTPLHQVQELLANGDYEEAEAGAHERMAVLASSGDANSVEAAELLDVLLESRWRTGSKLPTSALPCWIPRSVRMMLPVPNTLFGFWISHVVNVVTTSSGPRSDYRRHHQRCPRR